MNLTVALTGASGAVFCREAQRALEDEQAESLTAPSGQPEMRAARRNVC